MIASSGAVPSESDSIALGLSMETSSAEEILDWALQAYRSRIALACSFGGPSGMVLLDMVLQRAPETPVFYLDTGHLFPETLALVELVAQRYGKRPWAIRSALTPQ